MVEDEGNTMARFYVGGDRDQLFLMPVSMRDWLAEGHLAWFVIEVVAAVDTTAFHARHPNDGPGRAAYDPEMMLALLFYSYGTGLRSSRRIEAACRTDAAYRVICGGVSPDHATIARFLVDHQDGLATVFIDVLRLCAAAGLVTLGTIAIDGTKIGADAALDANRKSDPIQTEVDQILARARATDTAEDTASELFSVELPTEFATRTGRLARLQDALAQIKAQELAAATEAATQAARAQDAAKTGAKLRGRKPHDPHAALARARAEHTAALTRAAATAAARAAKEQAAAAAGQKVTGRKPAPTDHLAQAAAALAAAQAAADTADPPKAYQANTTDPDSRIMKTTSGWIQGYNAQAAVNTHQIVIACAVTQQLNDIGQYQPMVTATQQALTAAGITTPIGLVLADAGYWSEDNATTPGPDRLIATLKDWKQRRAAQDLGTTSGPPPEDASTSQAMEHRLRTPEGTHAYAQRSHTVEPLFGNIKENRGWRRFQRRGLPAVTSEWMLMNLSHNIGKLFDHTHPTPEPT
jgi:transposase